MLIGLINDPMVFHILLQPKMCPSVEKKSIKALLRSLQAVILVLVCADTVTSNVQNLELVIHKMSINHQLKTVCLPNDCADVGQWNKYWQDNLAHTHTRVLHSKVSWGIEAVPPQEAVKAKTWLKQGCRSRVHTDDWLPGKVHTEGGTDCVSG